MDITELAPWHLAWACSVPLIVLNVVIHICGLVAIQSRLTPALGGLPGRRERVTRFAVVMGLTVAAITVLHAIEGTMWAAAYRIVGAIPDFGQAMLYSIDAITTYGHARLSMTPHWRMMGALEALNGMILFGLSTAFLFAMIQSSDLMRQK